MNYYIAEGTTQRGPFVEHELAGANLRKDQLVWREGLADWLPARQLPELAPYLAAAGVATAPPAALPTPLGYSQPSAMTYPPAGDVSSRKIAAGICGILFGTFGVHKFIAGLTGGAVTMLVVSLCAIVLGPFTCGITILALPVMHIIGLIEGIVYLTKSDLEFYNLYMVQKRQWF